MMNSRADLMEMVPQTVAPEPVCIPVAFPACAVYLPGIRFREAFRTEPEYRRTLHSSHVALESWETLAYLTLWFSGWFGVGCCFI